MHSVLRRWSQHWKSPMVWAVKWCGSWWCQDSDVKYAWVWIYLLAERPWTHFNDLQASVFSSVNWWSQYRMEPDRVIVKTKWDYTFSKYVLNTYCVQGMRLTAGDIVVSKTDLPLPSWITLSNGINNLTGKSAHSVLAIISSNSTNNLKWDQFALPWIQACFCVLIGGGWGIPSQ